MKKSDIKTGVIYSYAMSKYDAPAAIVVLDLVSAIETRKPIFGKVYNLTDEEEEARKALYSRHARFAMAAEQKDLFGHSKRGMLAVKFTPPRRYGARSVDPEVKDFDVTRLLEITKEQALTCNHWAAPTLKRYGFPDEVTVMILDNGRGIQGEWFEEREAEEALKQARLDAQRVQQGAREAREAAGRERVDRLKALGIQGLGEVTEAPRWGDRTTTYNTSSERWLNLTSAQVDALLSLIPPGAMYYDPNVADDGWSYVKPDGARDE